MLKLETAKYWRSFYRITNTLERYFNGRLKADEEKDVRKTLDAFAERVLGEEKTDIPEVHLKRADRIIRTNVFKQLGLPFSPLSGEKKTAVFSLHFVKYATTAAVLLLLIGFSYWGFHPESAFRQQYLSWSVEPELLLQTADSERKTLRLPDGTCFFLNGNSSICYKPGAFNKSSRELWLTGEAFFEVAKDPAKPFIIHSPGGLRTTVLGTSFNVKAYPELNEQVVSVLTGKVTVSGKGGEPIRITPGQKAVFNWQVNSLTAGTTDGELAASWRNDRIVFDGADRREIALRIRQRFGKEVTIQNNTLAAAHFNASYPPQTSLEQIVKAIALACEVQYTINENQIIFK